MRIIWGRHPQGGAVTSFDVEDDDDDHDDHDVEDDDDDDDKSLTQCQRAVEDLPEVGRSQNLIEIAYSKRGLALSRKSEKLSKTIYSQFTCCIFLILCLNFGFGC